MREALRPLQLFGCSGRAQIASFSLLRQLAPCITRGRSTAPAVGSHRPLYSRYKQDLVGPYQSSPVRAHRYFSSGTRLCARDEESTASIARRLEELASEQEAIEAGVRQLRSIETERATAENSSTDSINVEEATGQSPESFSQPSRESLPSNYREDYSDPPHLPPSASSPPPTINETTVPYDTKDGSSRIWNDPRVEQLVQRASVLSHRLNVLTGTDYSPIQDLRNSIKQHEASIRQAYQNVRDAKSSHDKALATQAAQQKEVVQLLERKHSWSATDLERYMKLIRSEHIEEQAVTEAKKGIEQAEQALEDLRRDVEKKERRLYHEEQVWSDTIRRNSTWVTFGLMGVNVFLLLLSLAIIEPWRRRRLVKEVRRTLNEQAPVGAAMAGSSLGQDLNTDPEITRVTIDLPAARLADQPSPLEEDIDAVTPPTRESLETVQATTAARPEQNTINEAPVAASTRLSRPLIGSFLAAPNLYAAARILNHWWHDLFSEQPIEPALRQKDYTEAIIRWTAVGVALGGAIVAAVLNSSR